MADEPSPPRLWISGPGGAPRSSALQEGRTVIGRGDHCDLTLDDEAVSLDHVEIARRGPSLMATDLDSRNGTLLNGERLTRQRRLRNGDVLQVGGQRLEIALPPQQRHDTTVAAPREGIDLTEDERAVAVALVAPYRSAEVRAPRPATRAQIANTLHLSERTIQRRMDTLARKLKVPTEPKRERPHLIADRVLELGIGADR